MNSRKGLPYKYFASKYNCLLQKWDAPIYHSLRKSYGNTRNGLLGIKIPDKTTWIPERLLDNIPNMGLIIDWPRDYRTLENAIEEAYKKSIYGTTDLRRPLRQRNSYMR